METARSTWSRHSNLTKEKILEHNMRTAVLEDTSSPYYKGLLYSEKQAPSPKRESHANTNTSGGSLSSIISLFQILSCGMSRGSDEYDSSHPYTGGARKAPTKDTGKDMLIIGPKKEEKTVLQYRTSKNSGKSGINLVEKKSITERVPPPKRAQAPSTIMMEIKSEAGVTDSEIFENWNKVRYALADKYRPEALEDFICNRNKASMLRTIVVRSLL